MEAALNEKRPVYFGGEFVECRIFDRALLPRDITFSGPAIIEQSDATTVVEPGMKCRVDTQGNLIIEEAK